MVFDERVSEDLVDARPPVGRLVQHALDELTKVDAVQVRQLRYLRAQTVSEISLKNTQR